ncbi:MAG: hypothetical protein K8T26_01495 [Lentisphaerae bacterium]|nr:hypothetical protein [Lentisphaerota bacterium]
MAKDAKPQQVFDFIQSCVLRHIDRLQAKAGKKPDAKQASDPLASIPAAARTHLQQVLATSDLSYRDGLLIQLAYGLAAGEKNLTVRHTGARTVAQRLGAFLMEQHIPARKDAYQNIGKNSTVLVRGNNKSFDSCLKWFSRSTTTSAQLEIAFEYACSVVASKARPVDKMPELSITTLTFAAVMGVLRKLFDAGSGGAYEQLGVAALLHGLLMQAGLETLRVETKNLNASDHSSRVAGDVQILTGNRVIEAYEITANSWRTKTVGAATTIKENDLSRLHIIARIPEEDRIAVYTEIATRPEEISVVDLEGFTGSLVAALTRQYRAVALGRLYEFLDRYQPEVGRVNMYVQLLRTSGLVADSKLAPATGSSGEPPPKSQA